MEDFEQFAKTLVLKYLPPGIGQSPDIGFKRIADLFTNRAELLFDPALATAQVKVHIHDYVTDSNLNRLSPHLAGIKKLDTLETDRDGLVNLAQAGVQISVSPELLRRAIRAYEAVLDITFKRGWSVEASEAGVLRILLAGSSFELVVTEKTEPVLGIKSPARRALSTKAERCARGQPDRRKSQRRDLR